MRTKVCARCHEAQPLTEFHPRMQRGKKSLQSYCMGCARQIKRDWRADHPSPPRRAYTLTPGGRTRSSPDKTLLAVDIPVEVKRRLIALCQADADLGLHTTITALVNEALDEYLTALGFGEQQEGAA